MDEMSCWRLVLAGFATKEEIERSYSLVDVMKANAILDLKNELESNISVV
jgi:hypothetical protein